VELVLRICPHLLVTPSITLTGILSYYDLLGAGRPSGRSSSPGTVKNFLFTTSCRLALWPNYYPIQWEPGPLSPGVKQPGREADNSPPTSVDVKNIWIYTSTPHTPSWHSASLVNHRDKLNFLYQAISSVTKITASSFVLFELCFLMARNYPVSLRF
jgi:hypothetical protein